MHISMYALRRTDRRVCRSADSRVAVSRMTNLRPGVSMCRCEGSLCPHELLFTRVRLRNELSMSCDSIRSNPAKPAQKVMEMKLQMTSSLRPRNLWMH